MHNNKWRAPLILISLLAAVLLPVIFASHADIKNGQVQFAAQNYAGALNSYKRAARFLFWRDDLWEQVGISAGLNGNPTEAITYLNLAPKLSELL